MTRVNNGTADDAKTKSKDGLGEAPAWDATFEDFAAFLARGYGLPGAFHVRRIVRAGGRDGTGLTVYVEDPDGQKFQIQYQREIDCTNPVRLRGRAAADTRGLTRGGLITSQKAAMAMYEAMCRMADKFEAATDEDMTWEWAQQLVNIAGQAPGNLDEYLPLKRVQDHPYSKSLIQDPPIDRTGNKLKPVPLLLADDAGDLYVTARHMAVFLRYDLGVDGAGSDDQIITRLQAIGGERVQVQVWDKPGRDREHKVRLVLYRLPRDEA